MTTPETDLYVCMAIHPGRCGIEGTGSWLSHRCIEDEGNDGLCECVCGERWRG